MATHGETTREKPLSAILHLVPEAAQAYPALYTIVNDGAADTVLNAWRRQAPGMPTQCQIPPRASARSMTRLHAGRSAVLDLGHLDRDTVTDILRA